MRTPISILMIALLFAAASVMVAAEWQSATSTAVPPPWAYGFATPPGAPAPPAAARGGNAGNRSAPAADAMQKVEGSKFSFTLGQIRDGFGPADWFPEDHPQMPDIVAHGIRDKQVNACSLCHYPNGKGRPENAPVSGLPYDYFVQQMMDFRNDLRTSADSRKTNTGRMAAYAKAMTDEEIRAAAAYFSSMKWTPWIRVVESDTAPKTRISGGLFIALDGPQAGAEPLGKRIIEVPEKSFDSESLRNPRSGFIAYVPRGSLKKGEALVKTGGSGKTVQCGVCHGTDLKGLGPVPGIAGRPASYIARQLFDIQQGSRHGTWSALMKATVANLNEDDLISISAYVASLAP
jgi:cytochrome c553